MAICMLATATFLLLTPDGRKWFQRLTVNHAWCRAQIAATEPFLELLDAHLQTHGCYPETLDEILLAHPKAVPTLPANVRQEPWRYVRLSPTVFELKTTTMHWVSSFDMLIYRSDGRYEFEDADSFEIGRWYYVIGAQHVWSADQ